MSDIISQLRLLASCHIGVDLVQRLKNAEADQRRQRDAMSQAADEIERLTARVRELEAETRKYATSTG